MKQLSSLTQCGFKGRNRLHNRINATLLTEDGHPDLPRSIVPEGHRLCHVNDEMRLLALAYDVACLMFQQIPEILHVGGVVGVEELLRCLLNLRGTEACVLEAPQSFEVLLDLSKTNRQDVCGAQPLRECVFILHHGEMLPCEVLWPHR